MKQTKLLIFLSVLFISTAVQSFAQETLPPVTVTSVNYKYILSVHDADAAQPVKLLQRYAAGYDIKNADFYEDEFDEYAVSISLPNGLILGTYNKEGKLLRTAERFKNVALPASVRKAVVTRYPGWTIAKDIYLVNFYADSEKDPKKVYKLILENGDRRIRVKSTEKGDFMD